MASCGESVVALLSTPLDELAACMDTEQLSKLLEKLKQAQEQKPKVSCLREESARKLERMFGEYGQAVAQLCRHLSLEKCTAKTSRPKDRVQQTQFGNSLPASWAEVTLEATLKCTTRNKEHATFLLCSSVTTTHEHDEEEVDGVWYLLRGRFPRTGQWDVQTLWGNERNVQLTERMQQALGLELVQQLPPHVFAYAVMSAALALMQRVLPDNSSLDHCGHKIRRDLQAEAHQQPAPIPRRNSLGNILNATMAAPQYQQQNTSFATAPVAGPMWTGPGGLQPSASTGSVSQGGRAVSPQPPMVSGSMMRSQSPGSQLVLAQQQDGSGSPRSRQQQQQQQASLAAAAAQQQAQAVAQTGRASGAVNPQHAGTDPQQVRRPSTGAANAAVRPTQAQTLPMHPHAHMQMGGHYQLPARQGQQAGGGGYMHVQPAPRNGAASPYSGQASPGWQPAVR